MSHFGTSNRWQHVCSPFSASCSHITSREARNWLFISFLRLICLGELVPFLPKLKVTVPAYNHSDTNRQPFKRSGKKYIWNRYGKTLKKILLPVFVCTGGKESNMKIQATLCQICSWCCCKSEALVKVGFSSKNRDKILSERAMHLNAVIATASVIFRISLLCWRKNSNLAWVSSLASEEGLTLWF